MKQWTKPVAMLVAWMLSVTQMVPVAFAHQYLRPTDTAESGTSGHDLRKDTAWVWGPSGADPVTTIGRENLVSLGKEVVSDAFNEGRAFPLVGPGARPIDELVESYAIGYQPRSGTPLSDKGKADLKERLKKVQAGLEQALGDETISMDWPAPSALHLGPEIGSRRYLLRELARFTPILDESGTPALASVGVAGTLTHQALIAYGSQHKFQGWNDAPLTLLGETTILDHTSGMPRKAREAIGAKNVYLSLDQVEGMLADGQEGLDALRLKLRHEVNDALRGRHEDEPREIQDRVNAVIGKVFQSVETAKAIQQAEYLRQRKAAAEKQAGDLAKRVQIVPYLMNLGQFFEGNRPPAYILRMIEARLEQAAREGRITDSRVKPLGHLALLDVHYNGPERNAEVDRFIVDLVTEVIARDQQRERVQAAPQDTRVLANGAVENAEAVTQTWQELQGLLARDSRSFREAIRKSRDPYYVLDAQASGALQQAGLLVNGQIPDAVRNVVLSGTDGLDPFNRRETFQVAAEAPVTDGRPVALKEGWAGLGTLPYEVRMRQLLRGPNGSFAFKHGGSEPVWYSIALGGGPAAFNWAVMKLLDEAVQNQLKIEGIRNAELVALRGEYGKYRRALEPRSGHTIQAAAQLLHGALDKYFTAEEQIDPSLSEPLTALKAAHEEYRSAVESGSSTLQAAVARFHEMLERYLAREQARLDQVTELKDAKAASDKYQEALRTGNPDLVKDLEFNAENLAKLAAEEGPGYVVVVKSVADILAGKRKPRTYRFVYPRSAPYIHTLVDDQTEWVITEALPRPGSRRYDVSKSPEDQDPMLMVMVDPVSGPPTAGESLNPILVGLQQSGFPALGEYAAATSQPYLTIAGSGEGTVHRGTIPVTAEEADSGAFADRGLVRVVSDTYMSHGTSRPQDKPGLIPHAEIQDQVGMTSDIRATREKNLWVHDELAMMGTFQPAVTAPEAERRAHAAVHALGDRYHEIPSVIVRNTDGSPKLGPGDKPVVKLDPILEASNQKAVITVDDGKADIGATGHQSPYALQYAAFRASFNVAKRRGLITDYQLAKAGEGLIQNYDLGNAGDDNHFILFHHRGVDDPDIHALWFSTFFRAGWLIHQLGYQLYGDMQDFVDPAVQDLIKRRQLHLYAHLDDEFIAELKKELEWMPEAGRWNEVQEGYNRVKQGIKSGDIVELRLPGNVGGMGIGLAGKTFSKEEIERFGYAAMVGNDKAAGGAFNFGIYWALRLSMLLTKIYVEKTIPRTALRHEIRAALEQEVAERMPETPAALQKEFVERLLDVGGELLPEQGQQFAEWIENGLVVETWDVIPGSRAFIDVEREDPQLLALLSAQNEHNVKRIWVKKRKGWLNDLTSDEVSAIERQVDQELRDNRAQFEERKAQLQQEVASKKRSLGVLNPWERMLHDQDIDVVIAAVRPRFMEVYKVRMFLGDDYLASVSTEKLAAITHGQYVGKDDSVMIGLEPFMALYRGIAKRFVRVNVGNARGSHWVAIRPERSPVAGGISKSAVAVQWSNPIEIAYRYRLNADGTVVADERTGLARREDMYGAAAFDAIRDKVSNFNLIWIQTQGGFTPHGPNVLRDVEAAYPARQTLESLIRPDSPFAFPVDDTTLTTIQQGQWVKQYPDAAGYVVSKSVAGASADAAAPKWVVVHASVYDAPDAAIVHQQIKRQLETVLNGGESALRFALVVDGTTSAEDAEKVAEAIFKAIPDASGHTVTLTRDDFALVLPGLIAPGDLVGRLEAAKPGSTIGSVIGPKEWAQSIKAATRHPDQVAAIAFDHPEDRAKVASGARAIIAGFEAAAAGGRLGPQVAAKLDVRQVGDLSVPEDLPMLPETSAGIRAYQERKRSVQTDAIGK